MAIEAKNALTTAYNEAPNRVPANGSAGTDLAGQEFSPGVYTASSSLLLSSGSVTLNAEGNPNAVFIFQVGSTLITESNTSVSLVDGAQACNVFWQVGSSATLGSGTRFVGTIMASASITANTGATIHGRLLARTAAVTLEDNTITDSTCASSVSGSGGGTETSTGEETTALEKALAGGATTTGGGNYHCRRDDPRRGSYERHRRCPSTAIGVTAPCRSHRIARRSTTNAISAIARARQPNRTHPRVPRFRTGGAHSPVEHRAGGGLPARHRRPPL